MTRSSTLRLFALLTLILTLGACASATQNEKQALVERAQASAERFSADPDMSWFRDNLSEAEGVLIIPTVAKAGLSVSMGLRSASRAPPPRLASLAPFVSKVSLSRLESRSLIHTFNSTTTKISLMNLLFLSSRPRQVNSI